MRKPQTPLQRFVGFAEKAICCANRANQVTEKATPGMAPLLFACLRHWCDGHAADYAKLDKEGYLLYLADLKRLREGWHDDSEQTDPDWEKQ